ncbi:hypothetical protein ANCDUO_18248 [Ancylostoma duodenale]|uniref:Uncharacterized protein n=1 Tax=Ancylostoma duodenale TaxID=51022 RepID=A0A0C2CPG0_9BILA|nr:hypothetical protein ANCDUO_18248 [Ancylostoma duodenale]
MRLKHARLCSALITAVEPTIAAAHTRGGGDVRPRRPAAAVTTPVAMCVALILLMNAFYKVYYWLFDLCEHALVSALLLATVFFFFLPVLFNLESPSQATPNSMRRRADPSDPGSEEGTAINDYFWQTIGP